MIEICVENNFRCVYRIEDWEILRSQYRIIGELLGNNFTVPSLPLNLIPEEALLLKRKGVAKFVVYPKTALPPTHNDYKTYVDFKDDLIKHQEDIYKKLRKTQIQNILEKIVYGKRLRGDVRSEEEILSEELNKPFDVDDDKVLWPIFCHHSNAGDPVEVSEDVVLSQTNKIKLAVYTNLWERGYYITAGNKFGGDFLIYLGDPLLFHAVNIVRCIDNTQNIDPIELIAFGRLGTSVKKRAILASFNVNEEVSYITLNWIDA